MAKAANAFLGSLTDAQRAKATFAFDNPERTNWIFVPNYDQNPSGSCTGTTPATKFPYGCWTARSLVVGSGFAAAKGLTTSALQSDWSFAVVKDRFCYMTHLDLKVKLIYLTSELCSPLDICQPRISLE